MKKYLLLLSIVVLGIICISAVSAAEDVTVNGIKFHMIDGFKENSSDSVNGIPMTEFLNVYVKGDEAIYIKTMESGADNFEIDQSVFDDAFKDTDAEAKTINSHNGYLQTTDDGEYAFSFFQDTKIVTVTVPDESYLEKIII